MTNIKTGLCTYRLQKKYNPYYVSWQDHNKRYYAYFCSQWMAEDYKNRMIKQTKN